jgi:fatty acid metabolism transcriptional regulator FadR
MRLRCWPANEVEDHADAFATLDYNVFRGLAFASGNPVYGLILNGMKGLYTRIGRHYFANPEARSLALGFYHKLSKLCPKVCTIRFMRRCAATVTIPVKSGTVCRKRCRVI